MLKTDLLWNIKFHAVLLAEVAVVALALAACQPAHAGSVLDKTGTYESRKSTAEYDAAKAIIRASRQKQK